MICGIESCSSIGRMDSPRTVSEVYAQLRSKNFMIVSSYRAYASRKVLQGESSPVLKKKRSRDGPEPIRKLF
jgi:hypothetical protein